MPAYAWNATVGKWTHAWLASLSDRRDGFVAFPGADEIATRIRAAAERKRERSRTSLPSRRKTLAGLVGERMGRRALRRADAWARSRHCRQVGRGSRRNGDSKRSRSMSAKIVTLLLRGRADLLLAQTASAPDLARSS